MDDHKGRTRCNRWLAECLILGWEAEQLPALRALWWEHHDEQGNLKKPESSAGNAGVTAGDGKTFPASGTDGAGKRGEA